MANLLMRNENGFSVTAYDRALRIAKKLIVILRNDLEQFDVRLHMAQASTAAGLGCQDMHSMTFAKYPRAWDADRAIDLLLDRRILQDETTAVMSIEILEERHGYEQPSTRVTGESATVH